MWTLRKRIDQNRDSNQSDPRGTECGGTMNRARLTPATSRGHRFGSSRGQTITEFALVLPVFLLLVCGVVDFSNVLYNKMTMQNALRQAGRYATTGNTLPNQPTRVASIISIVEQAAAGLNLSSNSINISSNGTGGTGKNANPGGPGDIITISVNAGVPMLTPVMAPFFPPNGTYNYTVSVTFKNEPWNN